ncbi:asparaginyl-tRNA synthetase [Blastocladiella emersonii ATCC 22665]|nr:asparaginyl-tRNA synthetase [Blastocladiella emersonii ATCC 22665]
MHHAARRTAVATAARTRTHLAGTAAALAKAKAAASMAPSVRGSAAMSTASAPPSSSVPPSAGTDAPAAAATAKVGGTTVRPSLADRLGETSGVPTFGATVAEIFALPLDSRVTSQGWVKTFRVQKTHTFIQLSDGTTAAHLQIVVPGALRDLATGVAIRVAGTLKPSPAGLQQDVELHAEPADVTVVGGCDPSYPLQKKKHGIDFLREITHLRPRSNIFSAASRVRNASYVGLHDYFQQSGFVHIHTPLLTSSDCEGAGETFKVVAPSDVAPGADPAKPYFSTPSVNLTVSGQLHLEMFAHAHPRVYTFSPAFRAEQSLSTRHLSEFYMLEAEVSFVDSLQPLLDLTTGCVQAAARRVNLADVTLLADLADAGGDKSPAARTARRAAAEARVRDLAERPFAVLSYTDAVAYLASHKRAKMFKYPVKWGLALQAEHETLLAADVGRPVFVTDYPAPLKPFYMLPNALSSSESPDRTTVACFDLLVPGIGELVGGSLRQHDPEALARQLRDAGMDPEPYAWYLDLRRYGGAPHGGFGLGFDRLVRYLAGAESVRDVVPVPRYFGECRY